MYSFLQYVLIGFWFLETNKNYSSYFSDNNSFFFLLRRGENLNFSLKLSAPVWFPPHLFTIFFFQFSSVAQSCPILCDPMNCSTPGLPVHHQLPEFTQTHVHWVGDAIQPSHPLSSLSPAPNPSQHQSFSNELTLRMRWPKYWSFSFSVIPSKEIPGLISFRMDWLDLLAVQGTLKSLLQQFCRSVR